MFVSLSFALPSSKQHEFCFRVRFAHHGVSRRHITACIGLHSLGASKYSRGCFHLWVGFSIYINVLGISNEIFKYRLCHSRAKVIFLPYNNTCYKTCCTRGQGFAETTFPSVWAKYIKKNTWGMLL